MLAELAAVLLLSTPARAAEPAGKRLFDAHGCAACHRIGAKGGNSGPDLTLVGFRRSRHWLDIWLKSPRAWKHDTLMPEFKLDVPERLALADYLASLQKDDRPLPASGKELFARAGCAACHGAGGRGGHPNTNVPGGQIPALSKTAGTFTLEELRRKIARGSMPEKENPAGPEPLVSMPRWQERLSEAEIARVAQYVLTLADKTGEDF